MARSIALLAALATTWLLWSGHYDSFLLTLGAISVALCFFLARRMGVLDKETMPIHLGWHIGTYWLWLLKEIAVSNWVVIKTVLSPSMAISPAMVLVRCKSGTTLGQVLLGNSITLTPGTVTLDMEGDILTVHALHDPGPDGFDDMNGRVAEMEP